MLSLIHGDSFVELDKFEEGYFQSCVTDPPYGLTSIVKRFGKENSAPAKFGTDGRFQRLSKGFLGKEWDGTGIEKNKDFWAKVFRVLKPGGYLLSFGGTRTVHRIACAIEDAGFEIRDMLAWLYGQGYPKSHDLGEGWGTALKPAMEPIIMARKPIQCGLTNAENFEKFGTGGLDIDSSRIKGEPTPINKLEQWSGFGGLVRPDYTPTINTKGRWPSNLILGDDDLLGDKSKFFYCAKPSKSEKGIASGHPSVKPVELMVHLVKMVTKSGPVLDPFMGSGSTGLACKQLGFDFIGIDSTEEYYDISRERLKENKE